MFMHIIINAQYIEGYELELTFENGETRMVDLEPHLDGEIFEPLKNIEYFKTVQVNSDIDTITWENGDRKST
ncbi:MAG: DUF2442 domain-containing protein, partial [Bacteroidetes bacterium]